MHRRAALLAALTLAPPAFASSTRVATLANMSQFITDDSNIWIFPHMAERYTHMFALEYASCSPACAAGPAELQPVQSALGGGALLRLMEGLAVGVWTSDFDNGALNSAVAAVGAVGGGGQIGNLLADVDANGAPDVPNRKYDLFAAYRVSDPLTVGLHFTYGSVNYLKKPDPADRLPGVDSDRQEDVFRESDLRLDLGAGLDISETMGADVGIGYSRLGFAFVPNNDPPVVTAGGSNLPFSGGNAFALVGRFRMELTDFWSLYPAASYSYSSITLVEDSTVPALPASGQRTPLEPAEAFKRGFSQHNVDLGAAVRLRAGERVRFWGALGLQYLSIHGEVDHTRQDEIDRLDQADVTVWTLPYTRLAIEAELNEWLTFRAGAQKFVWSRSTRVEVNDRKDNDKDRVTVTDTDLVPTTGMPTFSSFVGTGIYYKGLKFDLMLDPQFFFRGPSFVSGQPGNLALRVSLAYMF